MNTVQASVIIPLRPQWVWHYVSDPLNWPTFLPYARTIRHTHGDQFEVQLEGIAAQPIQCKLVSSFREPPERLEWRILGGPLRGQGALLIQRDQYQSRVIVEIELERSGRGQAVLMLPVDMVQLTLERHLEKLSAILTGRVIQPQTEAAPKSHTLEAPRKPVEPSTKASVRALN